MCHGCVEIIDRLTGWNASTPAIRQIDLEGSVIETISICQHDLLVSKSMDS